MLDGRFYRWLRFACRPATFRLRLRRKKNARVRDVRGERESRSFGYYCIFSIGRAGRQDDSPDDSQNQRYLFPPVLNATTISPSRMVPLARSWW
jgi:hypothetical protein